MFAVWYASERTLSIHTIYTTKREGFYWLAVLFTFALGTAAGDLTAERLNVGYAWSLAHLRRGDRAGCGWRTTALNLNAVLAFWLAYILTTCAEGARAAPASSWSSRGTWRPRPRDVDTLLNGFSPRGHFSVTARGLSPGSMRRPSSERAVAWDSLCAGAGPRLAGMTRGARRRDPGGRRLQRARVLITGPRSRVQHVLLLSVDGLHQSDLDWFVTKHPSSALAVLTHRGVEFTHAQTPVPSDSFPGMVGQVTGGNPSSTGVYYDDTWNHALLPAGTTSCNGRDARAPK